MADLIPEGAIPIDQFEIEQPAMQLDSGVPEGAIPVDQFQEDERSESTTEQIKAGLEGAARGVAGPLATLAETELLGVSPEDIRRREEDFPVTAGVSEAAGLGAGLLSGAGALGAGAKAAAKYSLPSVMTKAGALAAEAVGLGEVAQGAKLGYKLGSEAVKQAAEMAILQSGTEAHKMIIQDPDLAAENHIANIGLATALGGAGGLAFGAISPLWTATAGPKLEAGLGALSRRLGGVEGAVADSSGIIKQSGLDLKPEIAAVIDGTPSARRMHSTLSQSDTRIAGKQYQKNLNETYTQASDKALETMGKNSSHLDDIMSKDRNSQGVELGETLHKDIKEQYRPIKEGYEKVGEEFRKAPIQQGHIQDAADKISQKALEEGWHKASSTASGNIKVMDNVLKDLGKQETAADLKQLITHIREANPFGSEGYKAAKDIGRILNETQEAVIEDGILARGARIEQRGGMGPSSQQLSERASAKLGEYKALKGQYKDFITKIDDLNEYIHVGKYHGPESFLNALKEMTPEHLATRLEGKNKADVLKLLGEVSPGTLEKVKQFHLDDLIRNSTKDGELNINQLSKKVTKLSPQIRDLILSPEQQSKLSAIGDVVTALKDNTHNYSNTARTIDKLMQYAPSSVAMVLGLAHNLGAGMAGFLLPLGINEGTAAVQLAMLKFMGSNQPIKSEAFKTMVQAIDKTIKGEAMVNKATAAVLKPGSQVVAQLPTQKDRDKLEKILDKNSEDPEMMLAQANKSHLSHYMPEAHTAMAKAAATATQYLASIKPKPMKLGPLDREIPPSKQDIARYNRALDIAISPVSILQHVKDGTLLPSDINDLNSMYPGLYKQFSAKLTEEITNQAANEELMPYKTKIGLSLFLGQALDTSMSPSSIQAAQPKPKAPSPQQEAKGSGKGSKKALEKMPSHYMTNTQAAEADNKRAE